MMQLVAGVAVAGAVAAGSTAFTASGVGGTITTVGGGSATITVAGATLNSAELLTDTAGGAANYDHFTGVKVNVTATPALSDANTKVSVAITGTGAAGSAASGTFYDCGAGSSGTWTCTIGTPATDYFTAVTGVSIKVAAKS